MIGYICKFMVVDIRNSELNLQYLIGRRVQIGVELVFELIRLGGFFGHLYNTRNYANFLRRHKLTVFIFIYPIRILCTTGFFIEVLYFNRLEYFYPIVFLLLIPYLFTLSTKFFKILAETERKYLELFVEIDKTDPEYYKVTQEEIILAIGAYPEELQEDYEVRRFDSLLYHHAACVNINRTMNTFSLVR